MLILLGGIAGLGVAAAIVGLFVRWEREAASVTITRDDWGIAHVYGKTDADAVFSGNVGCLIQLGRYLRGLKPGLTIAHPIDALWASYGGEKLK